MEYWRIQKRKRDCGVYWALWNSKLKVYILRSMGYEVGFMDEKGKVTVIEWRPVARADKGEISAVE